MKISIKISDDILEKTYFAGHMIMLNVIRRLRVKLYGERKHLTKKHVYLNKFALAIKFHPNRKQPLNT